ncbi:MAG: hypothetical protein SFU98_05715 [Leptospiraceae bacterium]|nr:hypothetical protein [Leptospiraceae bacterium]
MKLNVGLTILLISILTIDCGSKKKSSMLFIFPLLGSSNSGESSTPSNTIPPEVTSTSEQIPAEPNPPLVYNPNPVTPNPIINPNPPVSQPLPVVTPPVIDMDPVSFFPDDTFSWGRTANGENKRYPPEGYLWRSVGVVFKGNHFYCSNLSPLPKKGEPIPSHIKNVSLWKKLSNGSFQYVEGLTAACDPTYRVVKLFPSNKPNEKRFWNSNTLEELNELWLESDTTYRILVSSNIPNMNRNNLGKVNELGKIDSNPSQYFGYEFKTFGGGNACFQSFYDTYAYVADWESFQLFNFTPAGVQKDSAKHSFKVEHHSNCIAATGSSFGVDTLKPKEVTISLIPELKDQVLNLNEAYCHSIVNWDNGTMSSPEIPSIEGMCINHPGQPNEYINIYAKGYGYNPIELKNTCKGIWRTSPLSLAVYAFEKTRCSYTETPNPTPVCREEMKVDTTKGKWYQTPSENSVSGIHTFWKNQELYYSIKDLCKSGFYDFSMEAKNIFGPLPKSYDSFVISIMNTKNNEVYQMKLKASDLEYNTAKIRIPLEKGNTDLKILWTNDAYKKDEFDANIQIKSISLKFISEIGN